MRCKFSRHAQSGPSRFSRSTPGPPPRCPARAAARRCPGAAGRLVTGRSCRWSVRRRERPAESPAHRSPGRVRHGSGGLACSWASPIRACVSAEASNSGSASRKLSARRIRNEMTILFSVPSSMRAPSCARTSLACARSVSGEAGTDGLRSRAAQPPRPVPMAHTGRRRRRSDRGTRQTPPCAGGLLTGGRYEGRQPLVYPLRIHGARFGCLAQRTSNSAGTSARSCPSGLGALR